MLVGVLPQSCHYWLHPCSNLAWTISQNHNINWTVVDCCSQFLCSIVAARWTHDCFFFFFFFFCYSAFFLVHPLLQPSGLQTQKQKQCAIKLYSWVSCMHHSWYKRAISLSESNKCQITSIPFTKKLRICQNQEEFLGFSLVPLKA